ncbi:acyl-CoA desaturase [Patescibacteria group bacterium]|nr:acyl-CoA desaturase [Patescibacteria group bacterium]
MNYVQHLIQFVLISSLLFIAHWMLSLFTQTFFHHRYSAHRMFTMTQGWEKFWFLMSWLFQGASYLSPWAYGILHRRHHAYADQENDPHSPRYDKNIWAMMRRTAKEYHAIFTGKNRKDIEEFDKNLPQWYSFDQLGHMWPTRVLWIVAYVIVYTTLVEKFEVGMLGYLISIPLIIGHSIMGPMHGVVINWFAHGRGYKNYSLDNDSTNLWPRDLLMIGEGLHNNHHMRPSSPNFAHYANEFDPTYWVIKLFDKLDIIQLRVPTKGD